MSSHLIHIYNTHTRLPFNNKMCTFALKCSRKCFIVFITLHYKCKISADHSLYSKTRMGENNMKLFPSHFKLLAAVALPGDLFHL